MVLKNKVYHFSSNNDVLQLRGKKKFETKIDPSILVTHGPSGKKTKIKVLDEQEALKAEKHKLMEDRKLIKAFQKKILYD